MVIVQRKRGSSSTSEAATFSLWSHKYNQRPSLARRLVAFLPSLSFRESWRTHQDPFFVAFDEGHSITWPSDGAASTENIHFTSSTNTKQLGNYWARWTNRKQCTPSLRLLYVGWEATQLLVCVATTTLINAIITAPCLPWLLLINCQHLQIRLYMIHQPKRSRRKGHKSFLYTRN